MVTVSTSLLVYEPGDRMIIDYTTRRGATAGQYDLMLRLTSRGTGNNYYFFDDATDTNRWIHTAIRPMQTLTPQDGDAEIPTAGMDPIQIDDNTPSGTFDMKMYFSLPGKNTQVGEASTWTFVLDTPAPANQCFIATAAFGSPLDSSVVLLRRFRDRVLLGNKWGEKFVSFYYRHSPRLAAGIRDRPVVRKFVRALLWPVVILAKVWLTSGVGVLAILLLAGVFVWWSFSRHRRITVIAFVLLFCIGVMRAAEVRGSVVRAQTFPAPIPGASVTITNTSVQTVSGPDGTFRANNLATGTYQVTASAPGYQSTSQQVTLAAQTTVQNIVLPLTPRGLRTYEYFLPHTAESGGWWTFFAITNAGYTGADVAFVAFDERGHYLGTSTKLGRVEINQQFAGSPASFFAQDVGAKAAWYKITSSAPLSGIEMFGQTSGTIAGFPLTTAGTQSLFLPHIAVDSQWWTGISLVSTWTRAANVVLETRDGTGAVLASGNRLGVLQPGEKTVDVLKNYFGWDYPAGSQWASVQSDGPLTGFELFGTQDFQMMAAVPAVGVGVPHLFFPHVNTTSGWWTGIALLNVGNTSTTVKLTAYGTNGSNLATRTLALSSGARTVDQLQNYFAPWPANVKYVEVTSDGSLIAFELVGNFTLRSMSGMAASSASGAELSFPFVESDSDWDTNIWFANVSGVSTQATMDVFDSAGQRLSGMSTTLSPHASKEGTLKTLVGISLPNATSVRIRSTGGALVGYSSLSRLKGQGFADFSAQLVAETIAPGNAVSGAPSTADISKVLGAIKFDSDALGGIRVTWPSDVDSAVLSLTGGQFHSGDVVTTVDGVSVNSIADLRTAYLRGRERSTARVLVRRGRGPAISIDVRNPMLIPRAGAAQ